MEKNPSFSIIIPVYNIEKYIKECVYSILKQEYMDYEIILVDDGSPDSCPQICDELKAQDNRITVIHKKNAGVSAARKDGAINARGDYIICVDGDDWLAGNCLSEIAKVIEKTDVDIVCHGLSVLVDTGDAAADGGLAMIVLAEVLRVGEHGLEELQGHDLCAVVVDLIDARHAYVLNYAQMREIFLPEGHPEACATDCGIVLHERFKLFVIKEI